MLADPNRMRRWGARLGAAAAVALALVLAPTVLVGGGARLDRQRAERTRVQAAIRAREAANADKRRRIRALKHDPGAIEDIARGELGMVYPGELVIRVEATR